MPLYDNYGNNALDFGALVKNAWAGRKNLFRNNAEEDAAEFMKKQQEQEAAFKAAQEKNRKAQEALAPKAPAFPAIKETDLQVDNPVVKPTAEPTPEQIRAEALAQEKEITANSMTPKADASLFNRKFNDYAQQKQRQNLFRSNLDLTPKKIDIQTEQVEQTGKEPEIATAEEIQAYYAKPKEERTNPFLTASVEKETPPTSEPVDAEALVPEVETATAKPKARAVLTLPETEVRNPVGSFHSKYGNVADEAYNQRMADYELEKADAQRKRDVIDRAYRMQEEGYNYFKNQADAANAKDNGEEGAGWGNPLGFVNGIGKAFYGRAVYNPKTGRFEQKTPKSWEELGTNLFRNLATIGSGMRFSAGRNGRGGTSFAMDYNPGMPAAIINSYRQNQFRPYENYENFQKSLAEEYIGKPWQFDVDLPRAKHPFEEEMKKGVADDMLTQSTIRKLDQLAEFYGIPKGSDQYNILADQLFDVKTSLAPKLRNLVKEIQDSHLFDDSPELMNEIMKSAINNLLNIGDVEDKQTERELAAQQAENAQLRFIMDQDRRERELDRKEREFEEKKRVNDSLIAKNWAYVNGKGNIKTNVIKYDENGNPIELESYSLPKIQEKRNDLLNLYYQMEDGTIPKTPESLKAWAEMYDEFFLRSENVKGAEKHMGLLKEIDNSTGDIKTPGLSDIRTQFDNEYKALMDQAEKLSDTEKRRVEQFGEDATVNKLQTAVAGRDQREIPVEQKDKYRADIKKLRSDLMAADKDALAKVHPNYSVYDLSQAASYSPESAPFLEKADDIYRAAREGKTPRYQILNEVFDNIKNRVDLDVQEGIPVTEELIRRITAEELDKLDEYQRSTLGNTSLDDAMNKAIIRGYIHELVGPKF